MKGKIDKEGALWIERAGTEKKQACPHSDHRNFIPPQNGKVSIFVNYCGDDCPQFGEPESKLSAGFDPKLTSIKICQILTLVFDEFADERAK